MDNAIRFRRQIEHLHSLGVRPLAEFLVELANEVECKDVILGLLAEYEKRLTPEMIEAIGADRFPKRLPLLVPS